MIKKIKPIIRNCFLAILAIFLVLVLVLVLIQKKSKNIDINRIALVDIVGNNYIFRGNNPFIVEGDKKVFAYDKLIEYCNKTLLKQNRILPKDYYLIDISLLDLDEYNEIQKERQFFSDHPEHGGTVINISTLSPDLLLEKSANPSILHQYMANNYNLWVNDTLMKIREMALIQRDKPVIIYIHCDGGRDRTGMISAGYRMLFKDMNLSEARSKNVSDVGKNSRVLYDNAIRSYCLHVKKTYRKSDDFCM